MKRFLYGLVFPVAFAGIVLLLALRGGKFEYDEDEGLNLMKAALVSDGHPLYQSVWSDQPPGMTWMLAVGFKAFGESVWVGRGLVLGFSVLLLWSVGRIVLLLHGKMAAWAAMALLAASFNYARLSLSVMIGLPAVAMGTASLYLLLVWRMRPMPRKTGDVYLLGASAALFAAGMLTKMFVAEMLPVALVAFLVPMGERGRPGGWVAAWFLIVAALFGGGCAAGHVDFGQTIGTHLQAAAGEGKVIATWLRHDWYMVVLGLIGTVVAFKRGAAIPAVWAVISLIVVGLHRPIWYHHLLLMSVPLAWLAGTTANLLAAHSRRKTGIAIVVVGLFCGVKIWREGERLQAPVAQGDREIVELLRQANGKWVFADRPIYAFYAGKRVPPEVAVLSMKRMSVEKMDTLVSQTLDRYRPGRVEVGRFGFGREVAAELGENYVMMMKRERGTMYERR